MPAQRVALISCHEQGVPLRRWQDHGLHDCSVEGIARAIGADIWIGHVLDLEARWELLEYDCLVVNLHGCLCELVVDLATHYPHVIVHQEGSGAFWNHLAPELRHPYICALRAASLVLTQSEQLARTWRCFTPRPVEAMKFPFAADAREYRCPDESRRDRVFVGSSPLMDRGALLSLALARAAVPHDRWLIWTLRGHNARERDVVMGGRLRALFNADAIDIIPYERFIESLARCRVAVHFDPDSSLGRFAADCAAVGVPCVGYATTRFQRDLWPALSIDVGNEYAAVAIITRLATDRGYWQAAVDTADAAASEFTPAKVREAFWAAVNG